MKTTHEQRVINPNNIKILISRQAKVLIDYIEDVNEDELIDWIINERGIVLGGGDVLDFLLWKISKKEESKTLDGSAPS